MAAPKNPKGAKSDKIWRDAVMRAVNRISTDGKTKHLDIIAHRLIKAAAEGDVSALKEIGDRLDGRAAQSLAIGQDPDLEPVQHVVRPSLSREDWLKLHGR